MRSRLYSQLCALARRHGCAPGGAEDVVQDALLVAIEAARTDLADPDTARWLSGVVANLARMANRSARRRHSRDHDWQSQRPEPTPSDPDLLATTLADLPPALRSLATLVLTGHNRHEIAYLLHLTDAALRQRVTALKRRLKARGLAAPDEMVGLNLDLAYGRIRTALLPALQRHGGVFASHDPDGHVFLVRRSQNPPARQQLDRERHMTALP